MRIVDALMQRSYIFYDLHKIVVHIFEALTMGSNAHKAKSNKIYATCRICELGSCIPVPRPTMNYSVMSLPKAQALCTPHHENCGMSRAFCTPMMNLPTGSGSERFLGIPLTKIVGRLRHLSTPMMKLPTASGSEHFLRTPLTKIVGRLRLLPTPMLKLPTVSGSEHFLCSPPKKIAGRLRRLACPR